MDINDFTVPVQTGNGRFPESVFGSMRHRWDFVPGQAIRRMPPYSAFPNTLMRIKKTPPKRNLFFPDSNPGMGKIG
jgi:hypothetical protein